MKFWILLLLFIGLFVKFNQGKGCSYLQEKCESSDECCYTITCPCINGRQCCHNVICDVFPKTSHKICQLSKDCIEKKCEVSTIFIADKIDPVTPKSELSITSNTVSTYLTSLTVIVTSPDK
ncbi:uncharacterized protein LOC127288401 [Leptopilina boulardi]|uniref:uncharacterized protein LOC127288401 n=1 Tax=Leptopilina boulardi TaxID=63433 RepID=UPI0021F5CD41|nr:uncharacterized protein LOC127288401 [Leptopilina boulardi]